jgi:hypothetical protein
MPSEKQERAVATRMAVTKMSRRKAIRDSKFGS